MRQYAGWVGGRSVPLLEGVANASDSEVCPFQFHTSLQQAQVEFLVTSVQTSCTAFLPSLKLEFAEADDMIMYTNVGARLVILKPALLNFCDVHYLCAKLWNRLGVTTIIVLSED